MNKDKFPVVKPVQNDSHQWVMAIYIDETNFEPIGDCTKDGGHATEDEARMCLTKYMTPFTTLCAPLGPVERRCEVCGEWTSTCSEVNGKSIILCPAHQTYAQVAARSGLFV